MSGTGTTLLGTFGMTDYLLPMVLEDLTEEQARERSRGGEGPSIEWIVGHMLFYRHYVLNLLGHDRGQPYARFNEAATDGTDYPPIGELLNAWKELADDFHGAVLGKDEAEWHVTAEGEHEERTLRDQIVFFAWHEGYHMGALGSLRKAMGLAGPAEKVMAAREAAASGG